MRKFDLNSEIDADGFMKKEVFNSIYSTYTVNKTIDKDYVMFDHDHPTLIKNLEYSTLKFSEAESNSKTFL